jgi:hypothetical protein
MKKSKFPIDTPLVDKNIEQYCRSVEELLTDIHSKSMTKSGEKASVDTSILHYEEDMLEYE